MSSTYTDLCVHLIHARACAFRLLLDAVDEESEVTDAQIDIAERVLTAFPLGKDE